MKEKQNTKVENCENKEKDKNKKTKEKLTKKEKRKIIKNIIIIIIIILVFVFLAISESQELLHTDTILANDVNVEFGEFKTVYTDENTLRKKLSVMVKNKTNETKSYNIEIEAVDSTGQEIYRDTINVKNLGARKNKKYSAFTILPDEYIEKMKSATFKVVGITETK